MFSETKPEVRSKLLDIKFSNIIVEEEWRGKRGGGGGGGGGVNRR